MEKEKRSVLDELMDSRSPMETRRNKDKLYLAVRSADLIREKSLSKSAFAERMGRKPSVVSKWLSGTHNFTTETLSDIALKLDMTLPELIREQPTAVVYQKAFEISAGSGYFGPRPYGGGPTLAEVMSRVSNKHVFVSHSAADIEAATLLLSSIQPAYHALTYDNRGIIAVVDSGDYLKQTHPESDHKKLKIPVKA